MSFCIAQVKGLKPFLKCELKVQQESLAQPLLTYQTDVHKCTNLPELHLALHTRCLHIEKTNVRMVFF